MPSIKRCTAINTSTGAVTFVDVDVGSGATGPAGPGVPVGGTANQILSKIDASNYNTQWITPGVATVADGSITNAKLATMPANTVKMNNTAGVAAPTDVTVANLLAAFGVFTATLKGLVPPPTTVTSTKYLRDDGTWVVPPDTTGISQATADGLYLNVTGPDSMTGLLTLTTNATGKALQVNNSTDRGIDLLTSNAGLRVMRTVSNNPFIEFYDNTGTTNYGFIQYTASQVLIGKASTILLTGTTTSVTANVPLLLTADPAVALGAATRQYVDGRVLKAGDVMTGALTWTAGAGIVGDAVYGDLSVSAATSGGSIALKTGGITRMAVESTRIITSLPFEVGADPVNPLQVVTKQYLESNLRQTIATSSAVTAYTIALVDENKLTEYTAATAIAISVPTNATLALPIGYRTDFLQTGAGKITVAAVTPGTTTIVATPSAVLRAPGSMASLIKLGVDRWILTGDLT